MHGDDRSALPPVRLPSEEELAAEARSAPLFARAVRLARWAGTGIRVGADDPFPEERWKEAVVQLGLDGDPDGPLLVAEAWDLAVDTGLVEFRADTGTGEDEDGRDGVALASAELDRFTGGSPAQALGLWQEGLELALSDAVAFALEELTADAEDTADADDTGAATVVPEGENTGLEEPEWDAEEEADLLDNALANLYLLTATDPAVSAGAMVPLPVLAASMIVPDETEDPSDEMLELISETMMRLDGQFLVLAPIGLVEYHPVDEALTRESETDDLPADPATGLSDEDVSRYGMVRLTPLGLHGVRERLREAGFDAPLVGDLADAPARALLDALPGYPEESARTEVEGWIAARTVLGAAQELLAAARGRDADAPARRLACQQALSLAGAEAEPALREVLEDRELGGLARVWLVEHGAGDVPQPDEDMVFWLTVDTLAAQLATSGEPEELRELVRGLVDQHTGFFDKAWQADHPATGDVLEAMGRIHPDRRLAKEARKAAFKARSHAG